MQHLFSTGRRSCLPAITDMSLTKKLFIVTVTALLLSSCSARHHAVNKLATSLNHTDPAIVLRQLEKTEPPVRDYAQHHLDVGMLHFLIGDFNQAIKNLSLAKKEMAELDALSVTETTAAATINDTLSSYSGTPTDKVMVYNLLALSYLINNDLDAARVEVLQADVMIKKLSKANSLSAQLVSSQLISGIIFELLDENDDAFISYKHAASLQNERGLSLSRGLKLALLRQSLNLGLLEQHAQYKKQFNDISYQKNTASQVFMLYLDGVISSKKQIAVTAINPSDDHVIRIAMPSYPAPRYHSTRASLHADSTSYNTEIIEDLEAIVREDLGDIYPKILALTTARAIVKYNAVKSAQKQDGLLGALINIASVLTESADIRSWNMLPSNIQFAYLETDKTAIKLSTQKQKDDLVNISSQSQNLILVSSLTDKVFTYSQTHTEN